VVPASDQLSGSQQPDIQAVLVGAGDIGMCDGDRTARTGQLLDRFPGATFFTAGDNNNLHGTMEEFIRCYEPYWGKYKERTRPAPGNHDYFTAGAGPYYEYFGANAGPPGRGYYSYRAGAWLVLSLNSERYDAAQEAWLKQELAANATTKCTLAYWHHPLFSALYQTQGMHSAWKILYEANAEIVVNGHHHAYERYAPQTPDGVADDERGIREFVVGTGGGSPHAGGTPGRNSEIYEPSDTTVGVLKLVLHPAGYEWQFVSAEGSSFGDGGSGVCH